MKDSENKNHKINLGNYLLNKKATSEMWWIIVVALIAIIVVILILVWFKGTGEQAYGVVGKQLGGLNDCDKDNVADMFDKCPCVAGDTNAALDGCPTGVTKETLKDQKKLDDKECGCAK